MNMTTFGVILGLIPHSFPTGGGALASELLARRHYGGGRGRNLTSGGSAIGGVGILVLAFLSSGTTRRVVLVVFGIALLVLAVVMWHYHFQW
jgi:hypothetical protein